MIKNSEINKSRYATSERRFPKTVELYNITKKCKSIPVRVTKKDTTLFEPNQ